MIFIPLKHGFGPVKDAVSPRRETAGDIPAWLDLAQLLPGTMGFQIGFVDQEDAFLVTQMIPGCLVWIVAGADGIDLVAADGVHGSLHIL